MLVEGSTERSSYFTVFHIRSIHSLQPTGFHTNLEVLASRSSNNANVSVSSVSCIIHIYILYCCCFLTHKWGSFKHNSDCLQRKCSSSICIMTHACFTIEHVNKTKEI